MQVKPWTAAFVGSVQMFAVRSGCVYAIPVSTIATTTDSEPVVVSQAAGAALLVISHWLAHIGSVGVVSVAVTM